MFVPCSRHLAWVFKDLPQHFFFSNSFFLHSHNHPGAIIIIFAGKLSSCAPPHYPVGTFFLSSLDSCSIPPLGLFSVFVGNSRGSCLFWRYGKEATKSLWYFVLFYMYLFSFGFFKCPSPSKFLWIYFVLRFLLFVYIFFEYWTFITTILLFFSFQIIGA